MLPVDVVLRTCSPQDLTASVEGGTVTEVEWDGRAAVALVDLAESEELLADGLSGLAEENRLAVVVGPHRQGRATALAAALGAVPSVVLDDAHLLGVDEVLAAVEDLPEDAVLALSLDPALPLAAVPGAVALDLAASGACPVLKATVPRATSALDRARADLAAGRWPTTSDDDRSLVEVRVATPDEALVRVTQLVGTSIPRAFSVSAAEVAVLLAPGSLDPAAVAAAVAAFGVHVQALTGPLDREWAAAVVVLGPPGPAFTRALVYAGISAGARHVSVVHGSDRSALEAAVSGAPDRPRRTRLAALLTG